MGWLSFLLLAHLRFDSTPDNPGYVGLYAVVLGVVTFFVWVFALLPLYTGLPADSPFWRWPICTLCGTAAGTLISCAILLLLSFREFFAHPFFWIVENVFLGGIIGGVTCLFGSLTVSWFRWRVPFEPDAALAKFAPWLSGLQAWFRRQASRGKAWFLDLAGQ